MLRIYYGSFLKDSLLIKPRELYYKIQKRLFILLFLAVSIGPLLTITFYLNNYYKTTWIEHISEDLNNYAEFLAAKVEISLDQAYDYLYLIGEFVVNNKIKIKSNKNLIFDNNRFTCLFTYERKKNRYYMIINQLECKGILTSKILKELLERPYEKGILSVKSNSDNKISIVLFHHHKHKDLLVVGVLKQKYLEDIIYVKKFSKWTDIEIIDDKNNIIISTKYNKDLVSSYDYEVLNSRKREYNKDIEKILVKVPFNQNKWFIIVEEQIEKLISEFHDIFTKVLVLIFIAISVLIIVSIFIINYLVEGIKRADTQRLELSARMIETEKMALIGRLAANVAHEINNPLQIIEEEAGWMLDLLMDEHPEKVKNYREYSNSLENIKKQVKRVKLITHKLLGLRKSEVEEDLEININELIEETVGLLRKSADRRGIEIKLNLDPQIPTVRMSSLQFQQAILNILNNSIDAIVERGTIEVSSKLTQDQKIILEFSDTGPGIPSEILPKIFDPFFSTKKGVRNVGLGLYITSTFIKKLGGDIKVQNKPEGGALFTIILPVRK